MEFILTFIRGAFTQADREDRFPGRIDCPPHPDGIARLREKARLGLYPKTAAVFSSPLIRCVESARAIYPNAEIIIAEQLTAFDYGAFSGKTYGDIISQEQFKDWAKADYLQAFPQGETPHAFIARCGEALHTIIAHAQKEVLQSVSVITHHAVIGAILQRYSVPHCFYRDYPLGFGGGISATCKAQSASLRVLETF